MCKISKMMRKTRMNEEVYRINQESDTKDLIRFQLCGTTFPDKSYRINRPNSKLYCIEYIEDGRGVVHLDGDTFYPKKGDSYFLQAGRSQLYYSDKDDPWKKHFINVSGTLVEHLAKGYGLSDVSHYENLDLRSELLRIIELAKDENTCNTPALIAILNEMFLKMHSHIRSSDGLSQLGAQMKDFLNTQITGKFRIDLLCRHISKSESQTIRLFKQMFGVTPYAYVLDQKISFAKKLLSDTSLSIKQIADKLCFTDEYYFSNVFKKKTGLTPSQYRNSKQIIRID